jgi:peptidoglycan/xylan/chitin deacetylase (PgdA/CDA1 family)
MGALRRTLTMLACTALTGCEAPGPGAERSPALPGEAAPGAEAAGGPPRLPAMAVTIDDLPWIGATRPGESAGEALQRLIDAIVARGVPAMAFANCDRAGTGAPRFRQWLDAGLELGNHSAAHLDLNRAPLPQWLADVRTCHQMIHQLTGAATVWFRFPFLHQGATAERQDAALSLLEELGSPIAHVTVNNADWVLAVAYAQAVTAGDQARATAIADAFVDHVLRATGHYREVARRKVGRDVAHVLLLHANLLVADNMGRLLDELAARGFRFVSVAVAHQDPVYRAPDGYTGAQGLSWLYRMEPATPEDQAWDDAEAARLRREWR